MTSAERSEDPVLWGKQAEILRLLKHSKRTAVRSCNGSGKTFVAAAAVIWWLMANEHKSALAITTAPTQRQVTNLLWREIRSIYFKSAALIGGQITRTSLELSPNHYAMGLSTDSPERFQSFHEENILFIVDEACGVHEDVYEATEGSMTSRRARLLLIGNPTSVSGTFYKAFHQNRTQYKQIHISAFDTPNLTNPTSRPTRRDLRQGGERGVQLSPPSLPVKLARRPSAKARPEQNEERELEHGSKRSTEHSEPTSTTRTRITIPESIGTYHETPAPSASPHTIGPFQPEIPGIIKPSWVHDAELTWGSNSTQYQVRVLGEFPIDADDTLIPLRQIEAAITTGSDPTPAHRANSTTSNDAARPCHCEESDDVAISDQNGKIFRLSQERSCPHQPKCHPEALEGRQAANNLGDAHHSSATNHSDLTQPIHIDVDVARFGTDRTVICIRQGNHVLALNQHQKLNTMRTTGLVVNAIHKYNPQSVKIDEIGIGAGVLDRLHELNHTQVEGINVGNKATDPEHFFNLRSELYDNLRARFEEQTIVIPNDDDLIGQLAAIRVEYTSRGQLKVEPKETMRRRSLPSPDKADALLLAFAPTRHRSTFEVWV
jgi:hypothetical protein